jgi:hypothetical protein
MKPGKLDSGDGLRFRNEAERSRAKQSEAERSRAKQSEAERSRAKQSEAATAPLEMINTYSAFYAASLFTGHVPFSNSFSLLATEI